MTTLYAQHSGDSTLDMASLVSQACTRAVPSLWITPLPLFMLNIRPLSPLTTLFKQKNSMSFCAETMVCFLNNTSLTTPSASPVRNTRPIFASSLRPVVMLVLVHTMGMGLLKRLSKMSCHVHAHSCCMLQFIGLIRPIHSSGPWQSTTLSFSTIIFPIQTRVCHHSCCSQNNSGNTPSITNCMFLGVLSMFWTRRFRMVTSCHAGNLAPPVMFTWGFPNIMPAVSPSLSILILGA